MYSQRYKCHQQPHRSIILSLGACPAEEVHDSGITAASQRGLKTTSLLGMTESLSPSPVMFWAMGRQRPRPVAIWTSCSVRMHFSPQHVARIGKPPWSRCRRSPAEGGIHLSLINRPHLQKLPAVEPPHPHTSKVLDLAAGWQSTCGPRQAAFGADPGQMRPHHTAE